MVDSVFAIVVIYMSARQEVGRLIFENQT